MRISKRGRSVPASPIRKLVPLADEARRRGIRVYGLNIGQPDIPTPQIMWDALRGDLPKTLGYSPSPGIPELRAAFSTYYRSHGIDLDPSQILVTAGGSEALFFGVGSVCDPGDEILIPEPLYANYRGVSSILGAKVVPITCSPESGYHLPSPDAWECALSPRTRGILFSNPGNPTGTVYNDGEIEMIAQFAREKNLFLIVDEVYREFCYDGLVHKSILSVPGIEDRVILIDSISKRFSACGVRIGCLATKNPEIFDTCLRFAQARLSPPGLGQIAAVPALGLPKSYYEGFVREFQTRRDLLMEILRSEPTIRFQPPQGAFYLMAGLPVDDAERYVRWLLQEYQKDGETVMMAPGDGFYETAGMGTQEVRIAYVFEVEALRRAAIMIVESLKAYPGRV